MLNERKWRRGDLDQLLLIVRHRGAPEDERAVPGARITEVQAEGLLVEAEVGLDSQQTLAEGQVFLPYHRVLRVHDASGAVIFRGLPPAPPAPRAPRRPPPAARRAAPRRPAGARRSRRG